MNELTQREQSVALYPTFGGVGRGPLGGKVKASS